MRFKRGWATEERIAHLCGRVLDRPRTSACRRAGRADWFPAYRALERDLAAGERLRDPRRDPAFGEPLHVGRPNIGDRERLLERIGDALDRRWLTNDGPLVQEFEAAVAAMPGRAALHRHVQRHRGARDRHPRRRARPAR